ncbi:MAG: pyridoxamine 5'-phosphate oxidase family protein [Christensenellales bacterium]|jgi:general stress protein 26
MNQKNQKVIARAGEIIAQKAGGGSADCVLALIDEHGYPTASTISVAKSDGINWITFSTTAGNNRTKRIKKCSYASVCFSSPEYNITLVGNIEVLTDPDIKKEMWYDGLAGHFRGTDDPNYCVLRFKTERYNLLVDWKMATGSL